MGSTAAIVWNVLFGAIGAGYFIYGKRQQKAFPCSAGSRSWCSRIRVEAWALIIVARF